MKVRREGDEMRERQCGAHWKARSRTNSTESTWKEHALCFHVYRHPQQNVHE